MLPVLRVLTLNDQEVEGRVDGISVTLVNNTWNVDPRVNGIDFTQTITYDAQNLTRNVVFAWDFGPDDQAGVLSYPGIAFGESPWNRGDANEMVTRIDALRELNVAVDLSIAGRTDQFNVAFDLWLTDTPQGDFQTITTEVMIWLHAAQGDIPLPVAATWTSNGLTAKVYADDAFSIEPGLEWGYVAVVFDTDFLKGTVDIDGLLRFLAERGLVSGDDYISGLEFGSEVQGYAGRSTLHSIDLDYSAYSVTESADLITGTAAADLIEGRGGADLLDGLAGGDHLHGGAGSDHLRGGAGSDNLRGDTGDDRLWGGDDADNLQGNGGNDNLIGEHGSDLAFGGVGRDALMGGTGHDTLYGGQDNDRLVGDFGNDALHGDAGADRMTGGAGSDRIYLGDDSNRDTVIFQASSESPLSGRDIVFSFDPGEDVIDLRVFDLRPQSGFAGNPVAYGVWWTRAGQDIVVHADVSGDRTADFQLRLVSAAELGLTDFLL